MIKSQTSRDGSRRWRRAMFVAIGIGPILLGCQTTTNYSKYANEPVMNYRERHPIVVGFRPVSATVHTDPYYAGLDAVGKTEVAALARQYRNTGHGPIKVQVPAAGHHDHAIQNSLHQIRQIVSREGVDASVVTVRPSPHLSIDPHSPATLQLVFHRYSAEAGPCGNWPENVGHDPFNREYDNFGCAYQNALAVQVADPRDLLGPRGETQRSSVRRADVFEKYQRGEVTSTEKDEQASGAVSEVSE